LVKKEKAELQAHLAEFELCGYKSEAAKKCYRKLVLRWHPDRANGCANRAERFGKYSQLIAEIAEKKGLINRRQDA